MYLFYKKYFKTILDGLLFALTVYLVLLGLSFSFKIAAPVLISVLIYLMVSPLLNFFKKKGVKSSTAAHLSMWIFLCLLILGVFTIGSVVTSQIQNLVTLMPKGLNFFKHFLETHNEFLQQKVHAIPSDISSKIQGIAQTGVSKSASFLTGSLKYLLGSLKSFFTNIANFIIGIILAYFLCFEIDTWKTFINEKAPQSVKTGIHFLKANVFIGIGKYVKAQSILIGCSFSIIFIGLLCAKVDNAFSIAILAAILDVLPLLGIPVIFVPWAIYSLASGHVGFGIFLLCLLAGTMLFRQLTEPKIVGDSLGVSAFIMLSVMIMSLSVFGVGGIIASPLVIIIAKALIQEGYFSKLFSSSIDSKQ